jgi:hypothetical protein
LETERCRFAGQFAGLRASVGHFVVAGLGAIIGDLGTRKSRVPKQERGSTWPAYECLERLVVMAPLWLRGRVRLSMPAVALREPLAKAVLTSWRSGARSATTRIP